MTGVAVARTADPMAARNAMHGLASGAAAPGVLRRAVWFASETLALLGVVYAVPFVILAIGIPFALCVRLLLWVGGMLGGLF